MVTLPAYLPLPHAYIEALEPHSINKVLILDCQVLQEQHRNQQPVLRNVCLDGFYSSSTTLHGLVIDADKGLVLVSRAAVPGVFAVMRINVRPLKLPPTRLANKQAIKQNTLLLA